MAFVRVLNHLELESQLDRSGIGTAVDHQRAALSRTDCSVVTSPWAGGSPTGAIRSLYNGTGATASFDLAHCNMIGPQSVAIARYARANDIPLVLHAHVTREDFAESFRGSTAVGPALGRYLRWFYSQANLVCCPSEYTRSVLESYPVAAPIEVLSNGIDLDSMVGANEFRSEYRDRYDLEGTVVFSVGSVFERKGLTTFCETAQQLPYEFVWFGTYDTGPQASSTVRKWTNDPPENVTFSGWVDDKRGAFGAGDIFCFPAKVENQGLVVLEAMACSKPVVLRDIPVFREYYTHGEDCLLCETPDEFRDAVTELAENSSLRERLGNNARKTAESHGLDRLADRLTTLYEQVTTV